MPDGCTDDIRNFAHGLEVELQYGLIAGKLLAQGREARRNGGIAQGRLINQAQRPGELEQGLALAVIGRPKVDGPSAAQLCRLLLHHRTQVLDDGAKPDAGGARTVAGEDRIDRLLGAHRRGCWHLLSPFAAGYGKDGASSAAAAPFPAWPR